MTPVPSRGNRFSESPGPPVIWPCLTTAWMPSPNTGARGAPITIVVATTTGRDAKKSSPDEARDPLLGRRPDDPTTRMRQITEFPTPAVRTRRFAGTCSQPMHRQPRGPSAAEGP